MPPSSNTANKNNSPIQNLQNNNGLPKGWIEVNFGEVCTIKGGYAFKSSWYKNSGIPLLRISNIIKGKINFDTDTVYIESTGIDTYREYQVKKGDILIALSGATTGKFGTYNYENNCLLNQRVGCLRFYNQDLVIPRYFLYFLNIIRKDILKNAYGAAQPNISTNELEQFSVPLPPLPEQQRIVAKIEELFTDLDAGVSALKHIKIQLKRYRQAVLKAAFEGKLTEEWRKNNRPAETGAKLLERIREERKKKLGSKYKEPALFHIDDLSELPEGWMRSRLEDLIYIAGRIGWRGLKADEYTMDGPLFLSVYSLNYGEQVDGRDAYHITMERYDESPEIQLHNDDILLAKDGAGIGKIGIIKALPGLATVNSSLLVIRSGTALIPEFLFYYLKGPEMQRIVRERITGSATPHLFQRDIKKFELLIPSKEEQQKIVYEIQLCFSVADAIEKTVEQSLAQSERLRQSILKKAFKGKLVPQDPSDEPAEKLLERIRAEREIQVADARINGEKRKKARAVKVKKVKNARGKKIL